MEEKKVNATLLSHCDTELMTRAQIAKIITPKPTATHTPVPHIELIETLEARLKAVLKAKVTGEQWAVRSDGSILFGTMTLKYNDTDDGGAAIGIRTANNRLLSLQFVAGLSVFVCDNMVFRGDMIMLKRKHTSQLDLPVEIDEGLGRFADHFKVLTEEVNSLKSHKLLDATAKSRIHDAFIQGIMPLRFLPEVSHNYFEPPHKEFEPRTEWSLHNAFTEVMKQMQTTPRHIATQELGKFFGMQKAA